MDLAIHFKKINPSILFLVVSLFIYSNIHAQDKKAADTIASIIKNQKDHNQLCEDLYALGTYYWNIGDADDAQLAVSTCKEFAEKYNYEKGVYDAYSILGAISLKQNDITKTISISKECLQLATKNHSEYGANRANYLLVVMFYRQGKMDSVIYVSKKVLEAPHIVYDSVTLPKFNSMLANAYLAKGDFHSANKYYLDALDIAEKTNNKQLQSVCIGNLAIINDELKNYREALKYQYKGVVIAIKYNEAQQLATHYLSIGTIYKDLEIPDSAIYFYNKALLLYKQFNSDQDIAIVHTNLGGLLAYMNKPDSGMFYLELAKQEFLTLHDTINLAYNAITMGDTWMKIADLKKDKSYLNNALTEMLLCKTFAEKKEIEDLKMNCYKYLSQIYEGLGNQSQAFIYLKKYNVINDSIRSQEYTRQIAEMQTKYESEKKENEIAKLNSEKSLDAEKIARQRTFNYSLLSIAFLIFLSGFLILRNIQKKRVAEKHVAILEKQNAIESMRSKIAGDVHDDIGASLTRLGLNAQQLLMSTTIPGKEKELAEKISLQSKEVIAGMREIIWASNPANDNLKSMLSFMRQYIDRFFDGTDIRAVVNFPHAVGEMTLHPEVRRNLFLILKESLNNTVKYSGTDKIDIDFKNENENFLLNIKDYGKGIGHSPKDDFSNGLRNMEMRAAQIQSLFQLITAPGKGVQIVITGKLY